MLWSYHATSMPISWFARRRQPTQPRLRARALRLCECTPLRQRRVSADASPFGGHQHHHDAVNLTGAKFSSAPPESLPGHHSSQVLQFSSLGQDRRRRRCVAASPPNDVG